MGDNLYGAFQKAAKAMGMTTEELQKAVSQGKVFTDDFLPKFTKVLNADFVGSVSNAVRAQNKFTESWQRLWNEAVKAGFMESAADAMTKMSEVFNDPTTIESMKTWVSLLGQLLVKGAQLLGFAKDIMTIGESMKSIIEPLSTLHVAHEPS